MIVRNKEGLIKALYAKQSFTYGGHVSADISKNVYIIRDYDTIILIVSLGGVIEFFNNRFYSVTTSRLQKLLKEIFNINAPERKAYLFNTEPKRAFCLADGIAGKAFFNNDGSLAFFVEWINGENMHFISPTLLTQVISLKLADTWCGIEAKLLRGED
jgi:hypothetical protein